MPDKAPAEETSKLVESMTKAELLPPMVVVPVELPVLMLTAKLEEALRLTAPPVTVRPAVLVSCWEETKAVKKPWLPAVTTPAEVTSKEVKSKRLVPAVVPTKMLSQPEPMFKAFSVAAVPVKAPMLIALRVTWASPVTASMPTMLAVLVPPVALPIVVAMFRPWWVWVPVVSTGVVKVIFSKLLVAPESAVMVLAMVVNPFKEMAPVPVEKVPVPEMAKLPEAWV